VAEMLRQLQGMKTLTRFVARDQRESLKAIERQLASIHRFHPQG
jgi:hypothetical protein